MRNEAVRRGRGGEHPEGDFQPVQKWGPGFAVLDDEPGERFAGYALHDPIGREIGKVEKVFVSGGGEPEYVAVKIWSVWRKKTVLIPVEFVSVDGGQRALVLG